ncbi:AGAP007048-PA-like protein [Anopheles sinensis]|uniref:AGAP007048-PA-like protein n=1 Tax=Anopheles sinensis TaxID=74873 RepID=A0A084WJW2_ANOSI|nr:AGAP007048-PA-like protein [Anopheles sinensis]
MRRPGSTRACLCIVFTLAVFIVGAEEERNIESTTNDSSSDSAENGEVTFSNSTALHIEDTSVEVITSGLFKSNPMLEHFRLTALVHSIEQDAFSSVHRLITLQLDNNALPTVPTEAFRHLPHLRTLSVARNRIAGLYADDFLHANSLQWLSLSENFISYIQPSAFDRLPKLTFLNVSWNRLTSLDGFQSATRLNVLDLRYNYVKLLNYSHFQPLKDLRELSVRGNLLADGVSSGAFASLSELRRLDLGDNFLQSLPKQLLASNRKLKELDCEENALESLQDELFHGLTHLRMVNIRNNRLESLPRDTFRDQPTLTHLSLEENRFGQLEPSFFRSVDVLLQNNRIQVLQRVDTVNASLVQNLYLYGNSIVSIKQDAFENLSGLENLFLYYNEILELPPMLFHANHHLQYVNIGHNKLTKLRTNTFAGLAKLYAVDLSYNRLSVIEPGAFSGSPVEYLYLTGNRLKILDVGAFQGTRLVYLQLDDNGIDTLQQPELNGVSRNLTEFRAKDNRIASWQPLCLSLSPQLTTVDLQNNSLTSIEASCGKDHAGHDSIGVAYNLAWNGFLEVPPLAGRILSIDLSGNNLSRFQGQQLQRYQDTETVFLRDTLITKLSAYDFTFLIHLKHLEIGSKVLNSIAEDMFHLLKLEHLEINDSPLKELPHRLLRGQTNLSVVAFSRNRISFLAADFFQDAQKLEDINLAFNELTTIDPAWFKELKLLRKVNLEGNRIAQLPNNLFSLDHSLDAFSVAQNHLSSIEEAFFLAQVPIKALNLSYNLLAEVDVLNKNDKLTHLDVSSNQLSRLLVRGNFHVLIANSNQISSLRWQNSNSNWELVELQMANNSLKETDPRIFEARFLRTIDVSENLLNSFPFEMLYKLKLLRTIIVSRNNIRSVPMDVLNSFKLWTLDLLENPVDKKEDFLKSSFIANIIIDEQY